ncbi:MAG TPA: hypothetical protein VGM63_07175 [Mucilaginibacter sp.]
MNNLEEERDIRQEELTLVEYLISQATNVPNGLIIPTRVFTMKDGRMGSIKFKTEDHLGYQRDLITAHYRDTDDISILISLDLNVANQLFELDFFKGDFSPLIEYPIPEKLLIAKKP